MEILTSWLLTLGYKKMGDSGWNWSDLMDYINGGLEEEELLVLYNLELVPITWQNCMCRTSLRESPLKYEGPVVRWDNGMSVT